MLGDRDSRAAQDLDAAFHRIVAENSTYYLLGFVPTNEKQDGKYRRLAVRVKQPGLRVQARNGYVAPKAKG